MAAQAITSQDISAVTGRTHPAIESGAATPLALLQRLGAWYRRARQYRATVAELNKLSDHVLADIGIGRHEIHEVARSLSRQGA